MKSMTNCRTISIAPYRKLSNRLYWNGLKTTGIFAIFCTLHNIYASYAPLVQRKKTVDCPRHTKRI